MWVRSLHLRHVVVVGLLFCVILLLVPSYRFRNQYIGNALGPYASQRRPGTKAQIALQNRFPPLDEQVRTGKSLVFQSGTELPDFADEVLDPIANRTFLLLKTGSETMWSRMPVHFGTTMKRFPNHAIYSDVAAPIMGHQVIDALMHLPEFVLSSPGLFGYRVRRQDVYEHWAWGPRKLNIVGTGSGWDTDKFKNVPAFADAWAKAGDCEWFLMLDDDAYMLTPTFAALVKDKDPEQPWYFGKGVGRNPMFAHGGSGIILSRGAMRSIFGDQQDYERHAEAVARSAEYAPADCCGDSVLSKVYANYTGIPAERDLEITEANETLEHGIFQGNSLATTRINYDAWCNSIGAFHHVAPWEIEELFAWERVVLERRSATAGELSGPILYSDFYRDFILPHVATERPSWHFSTPTADFKEIIYKPDDKNEIRDGERVLSPVMSSPDCMRACELDNGCLTWHWQEKVLCRLFRYDVGRGEGFNPWSTSWKSEIANAKAGFMVDRIRAVRLDAQCDPLARNDHDEFNDNVETSEGWYLRDLEKARGPVHEWGIHNLKQEPISSGDTSSEH